MHECINWLEPHLVAASFALRALAGAPVVQQGAVHAAFDAVHGGGAAAARAEQHRRACRPVLLVDGAALRSFRQRLVGTVEQSDADERFTPEDDLACAVPAVADVGRAADHPGDRPGLPWLASDGSDAFSVEPRADPGEGPAVAAVPEDLRDVHAAEVGWDERLVLLFPGDLVAPRGFADQAALGDQGGLHAHVTFLDRFPLLAGAALGCCPLPVIRIVPGRVLGAV